jgi:hypothetical protein
MYAAKRKMRDNSSKRRNRKKHDINFLEIDTRLTRQSARADERSKKKNEGQLFEKIETGTFFICIITYFSTTLFTSVANHFHILMLKPTIFRFQGIA